MILTAKLSIKEPLLFRFDGDNDSKKIIRQSRNKKKADLERTKNGKIDTLQAIKHLLFI
jgi:hypothetical protein